MLLSATLIMTSVVIRLIAAGCGLGAALGDAWGNKKARKTDAYREEWLGKRKQQREKPPQ